MCKIELNMKEVNAMLRLPANKDDLAIAWVQVVTHGFIFNEFTLLVNTLTQIYKVKIDGRGDGQLIHITKIQKNDDGIATRTSKYHVNALEYLTKLTDFVKSSSYEKDIMKLYKNTDDTFLDIILPMSFIQYLMIEGKNRPVEYIEPKERTGNSKGSYSRRNKKAPYKLLDCIKIYQSKNKNRKEYTYQVESYPRRGGFRHYKNGKVVPYSPTTCRPKKKGDNKSDENRYTL